MSERDGERIAVCPGSYDPVTNGHLDIIRRTSRVFDRVIVGVVGNAPRKSGHLFSAEERKEFLENALADNDIGNVEVEIFRNLLVEFAQQRGGCSPKMTTELAGSLPTRCSPTITGRAGSAATRMRSAELFAWTIGSTW